MNLKKALGPSDVFCVASGSMISSGLFILPAIVYTKAGPAIIFSYIIGSILMIPAMFSQTELATAMPKSGGAYFFIHRSFGALFGTFAGFASWFSLSLKSAFALLGIGLFLQPLFPDTNIFIVKAIAIACAIVFTIINSIGTKESGKFQQILVYSLLILLAGFIFLNIPSIQTKNYIPLIPFGWNSIFTSTGIIFISFGGLTKIASIAGEIKNPSKNIPLGMFLAFFIVSFIYVAVITVTLGLLSKESLVSTSNPISLAASVNFGKSGYLILSIAAMLAFITTGNAGLLASSRIPMAMAEDNLLPGFLGKINLRFKTPIIAIISTSLFMAFSIIFLDLENLVKVASTMMLILFFLINLSVIFMRESKIMTYRPSYKSPLYPYIQILGMIAYLILIIDMGKVPFLITIIFFFVSIIWFFIYSKSRNKKQSALFHIVMRIMSKKIASPTLSEELKNILLERDMIEEDKFDKIIKKAQFIELDDSFGKNKLFNIISNFYAKKFNIPAPNVLKKFLDREDDFNSAIYDGLAIPHIIIEGKSIFDIVICRSKKGIYFGPGSSPVHIIFALVGSIDERKFHLQSLMAIAQIIQNKDFLTQWRKLHNIDELRNLILLSERIRKKKI